MKYLIILLLSLYLLVSCAPEKKDPPKPSWKPVYGQRMFTRIVKGKSSEDKMTQERRYSLWNDQFYNETHLHTEYYIAYVDGGTELVDARKYATLDKGDTVIKYENYVVKYTLVK